MSNPQIADDFLAAQSNLFSSDMQYTGVDELVSQRSARRERPRRTNSLRFTGPSQSKGESRPLQLRRAVFAHLGSGEGSAPTDDAHVWCITDSQDGLRISTPNKRIEPTAPPLILAKKSLQLGGSWLVVIFRLTGRRFPHDERDSRQPREGALAAYTEDAAANPSQANASPTPITNLKNA